MYSVTSNACIKLEFLAGTTVIEAVLEAKRIVAKLEVAYAVFKFNDVRFSVSVHADPEKMEKQYLDIDHSAKAYKYVIG